MMINIAILGFGVVGSGVAEVIKMNSETLAARLSGEKLHVKYIFDRKTFPGHELNDRVTTDFDKIINDEEVLIVVETMGGADFAYECAKKALCAGKSVVTSNKECVAKYGYELLKLARENNVSYLFEASVGGGIPIIRPMWQCLAANEILSVAGILNGTTNFILTKMIRDNESFETALKQAQSLGYAEANPTADIEGHDTCRKICILASLAFGYHVFPEQVHCEGIMNVSLPDIFCASKLGYGIKLIGKTEKTPDGVYVITCPSLVKREDTLAGINDVYNGIEVTGNAVEKVTFCGRGAGKIPTASAVMADVLDIIRDCKKNIGWEYTDKKFLCDYKNYKLKYFVRTNDENAKNYFDLSGCYQKDGEYAFITHKDTEKNLDGLLEKINIISKIRVLL